MKVVHLSTSAVGGAGRAALRSHQALLNEGVDSHFLHLGDAIEIENCHAFQSDRPNIPTRVMRRLGARATRRFRKGFSLPGSGASSCEVFSFAKSDHRLFNHPLIQAADVVHLHWVARFVNYPTFFRLVQKPIVWTLHDMNPFLGAFHYRGDQERSSPGMDRLDQKILNMKSKALGHAKSVSIVCPSQWLLDESSNSTVFHTRQHFLIRYALDLNVFRPLPKNVARETLQLPHDKRILLFVCESLGNYRKGFDLLMKGLAPLTGHRDVLLCTLGTPTEDHLWGIPNKSFGMTNDDTFLATVYSAADAFILTSREDNLPNVMLESLACGTPVLATPVGGAREIVVPGVTGLLANEVTPRGVQDLLERFLGSHPVFDSKQIRKYAVDLFSPKDHAQRLSELYINLLKTPGLV